MFRWWLIALSSAFLTLCSSPTAFSQVEPLPERIFETRPEKKVDRFEAPRQFPKKESERQERERLAKSRKSEWRERLLREPAEVDEMNLPPIKREEFRKEQHKTLVATRESQLGRFKKENLALFQDLSGHYPSLFDADPLPMPSEASPFSRPSSTSKEERAKLNLIRQESLRFQTDEDQSVQETISRYPDIASLVFCARREANAPPSRVRDVSSSCSFANPIGMDLLRAEISSRAFARRETDGQIPLYLDSDILVVSKASIENATLRHVVLDLADQRSCRLILVGGPGIADADRLLQKDLGLVRLASIIPTSAEDIRRAFPGIEEAHLTRAAKQMTHAADAWHKVSDCEIIRPVANEPWSNAVDRWIRSTPPKATVVLFGHQEHGMLRLPDGGSIELKELQHRLSEHDRFGLVLACQTASAGAVADVLTVGDLDYADTAHAVRRALQRMKRARSFARVSAKSSSPGISGPTRGAFLLALNEQLGRSGRIQSLRSGIAIGSIVSSAIALVLAPPLFERGQSGPNDDEKKRQAKSETNPFDWIPDLKYSTDDEDESWTSRN
jgi:hypothetical protein